MKTNKKYCMVLTTIDNHKNASKLAKSILQKKLGACIQISEIESFYRWKEKLNHESEILIRIKTKDELYSSLEEFICRQHPYEVPQIIKIPVSRGLTAYLQWIDENTV